MVSRGFLSSEVRKLYELIINDFLFVFPGWRGSPGDSLWFLSFLLQRGSSNCVISVCRRFNYTTDDWCDTVCLGLFGLMFRSGSWLFMQPPREPRFLKSPLRWDDKNMSYEMCFTKEMKVEPKTASFILWCFLKHILLLCFKFVWVSREILLHKHHRSEISTNVP